MNLILETEAGASSLSDYETELEVAALVMALLSGGHDYVRLLTSDEEFSTQWTVLERRKDGTVTLMGVQEFDGGMQVLTMEREDW